MQESESDSEDDDDDSMDSEDRKDERIQSARVGHVASFTYSHEFKFFAH